MCLPKSRKSKSLSNLARRVPLLGELGGPIDAFFARLGA
jgi:hypothetical protein